MQKCRMQNAKCQTQRVLGVGIMHSAFCIVHFALQRLRHPEPPSATPPAERASDHP
jgi:hypothetical protein